MNFETYGATFLYGKDSRRTLVTNRNATVFFLRSVGVLLVLLVGGVSTSCTSPSPTQRIDLYTWFSTLPANLQESILWTADYEEGDLSDWEDAGTDDYYSGGGIFYTPDEGEPDAEDVSAVIASGTVGPQPHSGSYAVETSISGAVRAENGNRAVRLMRWTDRPWNEDGDFFPDDAYYSTWVFFPQRYSPEKSAPWDPGDGGWWNVFQFKSDNNAGSQPIAVLNAWWDSVEKMMYFYLDVKEYPDANSDSHVNTTYDQSDPIPIPVGEWFHIEARYVKSTTTGGSVTVWQDGREIFSVNGIQTALSEQVAWGIGSYTDHIQSVDPDGEPIGTTGAALVYFDDGAVSTERLSQGF